MAHVVLGVVRGTGGVPQDPPQPPPPQQRLATQTPPHAQSQSQPQSPPHPSEEQDGAPARRGVVVDRDRRLAWADGEQLDLTYLQFELLDHLVSQPGRVFRREQLISAVWGYGGAGYASDRTVDVHIARLRRRLGPAGRHRIVTVRGAGYKYVP
ncbi:winged helix-turn-helix domain-containing protein [Phaeacidiphilus oryzae]|uniref:winged helix-turn-helix domain-containing protein n=1 Tax=Phaeacidiphilus oryzae TaxID=348818 RepID=UPI000AA1D653